MKVSCVMPTTEARRKFWPLAIAMFLSQDHSDCELLIVGDISFSGKEFFSEVRYLDLSTHDGGHRFLFPGTGKEIRVLKFDGTIGAKINHAAQNATGEIIMRVDDDDWYRQDRIRVQEKILDETGAQMTGLSSMMFYEEGADHGWEYWADAWEPLGATHAFVRDWLLDNPLADTSKGEDHDICERAREKHVLFTIGGNRGLIIARDHESHTGDRGSKSEREMLRSSRYQVNWIRHDLGEWAETTEIFCLANC